MKIHQRIIDELRYMADVYEETDDEDSESRMIDAGYLRSAADKFTRGESLSDNERQVVEDELSDWDTKDCWSEGAALKRLHEAQAALGMLEKFDPSDCYSRRPRTRLIDGVRYVVG